MRQRLLRADWSGDLDQALAPLSALDGVAADMPAADDAPALAPLSEREREVLALIARGDSNKLIARAFDLSPHTVKRHVANILDKLALQSRGQAAAWYLQRRTAAAA